MEVETMYDYIEEVNSSLECAICRTPFISPCMSPTCQHIFCTHCVVRALSLSPTCPIDRSPLSRDRLVDAPRIVHQLVDELKVRCPREGCGQVCERGGLEVHLRERCGERDEMRGDVKGKAREVEVDERTEDEDEQEEEEVIWVVCDLCRIDLLAQDLSSHSPICPSAVVNCTYCSSPLLRSSLPSHHLEDCSSIPIPCPHARHGCSARIARSLMLEEHLDVACPFEPIKEYLDAQREVIDRVEGENWMLRKRLDRLEEGMTEMREVLEGVRKGMGELWVAPTKEVAPIPTQEDDVEASTSTQEPTLGFFDSTSLLSAIPSTSPLPSLSPLPIPTSSPTATSISSQPASLSSHLDALQSQLTSLRTSHQTLDSRLSQQAHHESLRTSEEIASLRAVTHGLRMQMHHVLMDVNRLAVRRPGPGGGDSEGSDEELGGAILGGGGMMTMGWRRPMLGTPYAGTRRSNEFATLPVGMRVVGSSGGTGGGGGGGGMKL